MKLLYKNTIPKTYMFKIAFAAIADAMVILLSLGNYSSSFQLNIAIKNAQNLSKP